MLINVLWVEDEPQSVRYEQKLAEQHGWRIVFAETVSKALELISDTAFDLVVIDLILPLDDFHHQRGYVDPNMGIQLIEMIQEPTREGCTPPDVPLLVISAVVPPSPRVIEKLTSERYYLSKPLQEEVYRDVLAELTQALDPSKRGGLQSEISDDREARGGARDVQDEQ